MSALFVGDIHIYISDYTLARRFWVDGLGLRVVEEELSPHSVYARLDFDDGGPSIRLLGPVTSWSEDDRPESGMYPAVRFDITASDFDDVLVRLLEHGGEKVSEIESYQGLRAVTIADPDGNEFELLELAEEEDDDEVGADSGND